MPSTSTIRGIGVARHVALAGVGLEVRAIVRPVGVGELGDPLRRRVLARDPQRQALGVHEVVRTGRADGHQLRRLLGADELHHAVGGVDGQDLRALGADRAADRGQQGVERARGLDAAPAEARDVARALVDEVDGLVDDLDRLAVGLLGRLAPDDQAVLAEHDQLQVRVVAHGLADLLGQGEARADVRAPRRRRRRSTRAISRSPSRVPASTLIPSGCVWCTCGAGTKACSSVSIDARGAAGSSWQRAR